MECAFTARHRWVRIIVGGALAVAIAGCGAQDVDAPVTESTDRCPSVDAMIPGVLRLLDADGLGSLRQVLSEDINAAARADLVKTAIDLVGALPAGSLKNLAAAGAGLDSDGRLQDFGARLVRWVGVQGPGAPYAETMSGVRRLLASCEGPPVLALLRTLLADEALLCALRELPAALDLESILAHVEVDRSAGSTAGLAAFRALVRNLLLAATSPDFTVDAWLDLLGLVTDLDAPPLGPAIAGARRLLDDAAARASIAGLAACVLQADPELALAELLFDLLTDDDLDLAASLELLDPSRGPILSPLLLDIADGALAFLETDAFARRSLVTVLAAALAPQIVQGVLEDLGRFLDARVLSEITSVLSALATRSCAQ
jgi:hypothetical protein